MHIFAYIVEILVLHASYALLQTLNEKKKEENNKNEETVSISIT